METIKVQYTDPNTGLDRLDTFRFDLLKFRKDESDLPVENFFFTASATNVTSIKEIPDLMEASIAANPFNPFACSNTPVIYGLVASVPNTNEIIMNANPIILGFEEDVPVAILRNFADTTPLAFLKPTGVTETKLEFSAEDNVDGLSIKQNYVVIKMVVPTPYVPSYTKENTNWGVKSLLEKPAPPVLDAFLDGSTLKVTLTPATLNSYVVEKYNIYVFSESNEDFTIPVPIVHGNRKPDLVLNPGDLTSKPVTTWGGGVNAGGGTITTGNYYIVAIAKDDSADMNVNCSFLSNIEYITISY